MIIDLADMSKEELVAALKKAMKQISELIDEKNRLKEMNLKEKLNETE